MTDYPADDLDARDDVRQANAEIRRSFLGDAFPADDLRHLVASDDHASWLGES